MGVREALEIYAPVDDVHARVYTPTVRKVLYRLFIHGRLGSILLRSEDKYTYAHGHLRFTRQANLKWEFASNLLLRWFLGSPARLVLMWK
jgi:hypothetical protein